MVAAFTVSTRCVARAARDTSVPAPSRVRGSTVPAYMVLPEPAQALRAPCASCWPRSRPTPRVRRPAGFRVAQGRVLCDNSAARRERTMTPRHRDTRQPPRPRANCPGSRPRASTGVGRRRDPVFWSHDLFVSCLRSVLRHTHEDVPILVADDASPDPASARFLQKLDHSGSLRHRMLYFRQEQNVGFVSNVNTAFELARPADVVVLEQRLSGRATMARAASRRCVFGLRHCDR